MGSHVDNGRAADGRAGSRFLVGLAATLAAIVVAGVAIMSAIRRRRKRRIMADRLDRAMHTVQAKE